MKRSVFFLLASTLVGVPAFAQIELAGNWVSRRREDWEQRGHGSEDVDYLGLPINDDPRRRRVYSSG